MINLLTKIEQDYGLPVAVSLAKQAIEQTTPLTRNLKTYKNRVTKCDIISNLLCWAPTKEGHKYWSCRSVNYLLSKEKIIPLLT